MVGITRSKVICTCHTSWNKTSLPAECGLKIINIRCLARIETPQNAWLFWIYSFCGPLLEVFKILEKDITISSITRIVLPIWGPVTPSPIIIITPMRLPPLLSLSLLPPCSHERDFTNEEGSMQGTLCKDGIKMYGDNRCVLPRTTGKHGCSWSPAGRLLAIRISTANGSWPRKPVLMLGIRGLTAIDLNTEESSICRPHSRGYPCGDMNTTVQNQ